MAEYEDDIVFNESGERKDKKPRTERQKRAEKDSLLKDTVYQYESHPLKGHDLKNRANWNAFYEGNHWAIPASTEGSDSSKETLETEGLIHLSKINQLKSAGHESNSFK